MINGKFGEIGELFFEIDLIAADRERFPIEVLLDTGFTTGWLALDTEDALSLGWVMIESERVMQTARYGLWNRKRDRA
jgi:predicted aspartyl protease